MNSQIKCQGKDTSAQFFYSSNRMEEKQQNAILLGIFL
jgi:hypothetical protein